LGWDTGKLRGMHRGIRAIGGKSEPIQGGG